MDANKLFSREALDKMRSPERLDQMLPITTPIGWMGLAAVGVLIFSVVLWSIFGAFTVKAEGKLSNLEAKLAAQNVTASHRAAQ